LLRATKSQGISLQGAWLHRSIYYLASGFMFAAAAVRSILVFQESPFFDQILLLMGGWALAFLGIALLGRKLSWLSVILMGIEILLTLNMLLISRTDFFVFLFAIPCMQVMQQFRTREAAVAIGLTTLLTFLTLFRPFGIFYALGTAVVFFGGSVFLIVYIRSTRQARVIQDQQQTLVNELQQANGQLESYAQQLQQLAAGRERQRLARELHDSVTQTIFSMTLTTQSALMLLERDRNQVAAQLDRLDQLARNTLSEMQFLISRLAPENTGGFVSTLQRHIDDRRRLDNLAVRLDVEGSQALTSAEEQSLFRIAQEALNNIVKHAGVTQAAIRLHLDEPPRMEIEDRGIGFDPRQVEGMGRVGLVSMQERAAEIGWRLSVESSPGNGTWIRVQRDSKG
jgi:signal transduction histidine kinase